MGGRLHLKVEVRRRRRRRGVGERGRKTTRWNVVVHLYLHLLGRGGVSHMTRE